MIQLLLEIERENLPAPLRLMLVSAYALVPNWFIEAIVFYSPDMIDGCFCVEYSIFFS